MNNVSYQKRLLKVIRTIEDNLDNPLSLDELSKVACFSPYHFHRVFSLMTGETVSAYIRRLRLERAALYLIYFREYSITEIAFSAGYGRVEAFTRSFRLFWGESPSSYRKKGILEVAFQRKLLKGVQAVNVEIKSFPPILVANVRYTGDCKTCGDAWEKFWNSMSQYILLEKVKVCYSMCYDDPDVTPADQCRMDMCIPLPEGVTEETPKVKEMISNTDITLRVIGDENKYASILIKGPYSLLHQAYRTLYGEWLPKSGYEPVFCPSIEAYLNDPRTTPEEELLTEIYVALSPKE